VVEPRPLKLLVFVVAYDAERTIVPVLDRIPRELGQRYDVSILVIDDCSHDHTGAVARRHLSEHGWCPWTVLRNPENQGYGGNQKVGFRFAVREGFDVVVLLHGDGQYAPECLPELVAPFAAPEPPDAVLGSRMLARGAARQGGMPLYKRVGNRVLTRMQNRLLGSALSEFHTGYRVYSVATLRRLPIDLNTNDFHFDTEIIVQLFFAGAKVVEIPVPTHYGDEICHVNGLAYAWNVTKASLKARLIRLGIFFDPKFSPPEAESPYVSKLEFHSTHSVALDLVPERSVVLDLGCAGGALAQRLHRDKNCRVYCADVEPARSIPGCHYQQCDLNQALPDVPWEELDVVVLLDVLEHLDDPEGFLARLRARLSGNSHVEVIASSGNVCFFVTRLMMLLGQFNYGRRGILDITHRRLFTVSSLERVLRYAAYDVLARRYVPPPYPLAIGTNAASAALLRVNGALARVVPGLFAYQSLYVMRPRASIEWLLHEAGGGEQAAAGRATARRARAQRRRASARGAPGPAGPRAPQRRPKTRGPSR
jgi:glycosyltransferase involved in cell wall biosynthesis